MTLAITREVGNYLKSKSKIPKKMNLSDYFHLLVLTNKITPVRANIGRFRRFLYHLKALDEFYTLKCITFQHNVFGKILSMAIKNQPIFDSI